jgi:hypothetical protein
VNDDTSTDTDTNTGTDVGFASKDSIVGGVVDRLAVRYPNASRPRIADIVGEEYEALAGGRIRNYIPTLVEHGARSRLRREFDGGTVDA